MKINDIIIREDLYPRMEIDAKKTQMVEKSKKEKIMLTLNPGSRSWSGKPRNSLIFKYLNGVI